MTVEYRREEFRDAYNSMKNVAGLKFVSVTLEEGLDFDPTPVDSANFPWKDSRLITAAVRSDTGEWIERSGSASDMDQSSKSQP
jgi:hypothetical protein